MIRRNRMPPPEGKVRYAVVGLGYFAQAAVLPAFAHVADSAELVALVSGEREKLDVLGKKYGARFTYDYESIDGCLGNPEIDAVYIALPNSMHCDFAVRAARAGVHILCEKPMALTEQECRRMIREAERSGVRLMIAYRLHFERANLEAIRKARSGELGKIRLIDALFTQQVQGPNIRLDPLLGGGPLYDMGIYCLNAARYLFGAEPIEVTAMTANGDPGRFEGIEEMLSGILRFPEERLAQFACSFGASDVSTYRVVGTLGDLRVEPAYDFAEGLRHVQTRGGSREETPFPKTDQVAAEIAYFSDCIKKDLDPEPSGWEGLADVRVIRALERSARTGRAIRLSRFDRPVRPSIEQVRERPPGEVPELLHARSPSGR